MSQYKPVIGLEIHVELKTKSKMFCQCEANYFGKDPNTNTCPVCLGLPGALPIPNQKAIEWTILIGKALGCEVKNVSKFDRKHYFYPDLPKGYQISQYDEPINRNGKVTLSKNGKSFRIHRVHLEEDTGKLLHQGEDTLIDFNRSGVPLVEIVTEPDFDNSDDVKAFLEELQVIVRYLGVSDADMEKGTMRLEPNISLRKVAEKGLPNYKVEVKNINSFSFVKKAIEYELKRQEEILENGETPVQETRGFNESKGITVSQRSKEEAHDYRYFPEPDIPPLNFTQEFLKKIESQLPELPNAKFKRYSQHIKENDAWILVRDRRNYEYFDGLELDGSLWQNAANLIINRRDFIKKNKREAEIIIAEPLTPIKTDLIVLNSAIELVLKQNEKAVSEYKSGKQNAIMFLVGQVMKEMKGQADAQAVKQELEKALT